VGGGIKNLREERKIMKILVQQGKYYNYLNMFSLAFSRW
jgi:hypothetical protein